MLDDGSYDVIVVDAEQTGDEGALRLELTILAGSHKGEVVSLQASGLGMDEIAALGLPGTLTVHQGDPTVSLDQ